jgi:hypothetical protein
MDRVGSPKTVVDIYDGNSRSTGVEHSEEGSDSLEVGSVANGSGNGDQWGAYESTENTGQGGFHSCNHEECMMFAKGIQMLNGTVKTCHADVIKASGAMTQKL